MEETNQKQSPKKFIKKPQILIISFALLILVILGVMIGFMSKPAVSPVSSEADRVLRGTIESADHKTLILKVDGSNYTLSIENTDDFQWVSNGNFDEGNAVFTKVNRLYMRAGQQALVTAKGNSAAVTKVILLTR